MESQDKELEARHQSDLANFDMVGPIAIQAKIFCTDGRAVAIGRAPIGIVSMAMGQIPTYAELAEAIDQWVRYQMAPGFRLMTKKEFWEYQQLTHAGITTPVEGSPEFTREWGQTDYQFPEGQEPPRLAPPGKNKKLSPAQRMMQRQQLDRAGVRSKKH